MFHKKNMPGFQVKTVNYRALNGLFRDASDLRLNIHQFPVKDAQEPAEQLVPKGLRGKAQVKAAGQAGTLPPQTSAQHSSIQPGVSSRLRAAPRGNKGLNFTLGTPNFKTCTLTDKSTKCPALKVIRLHGRRPTS